MRPRSLVGLENMIQVDGAYLYNVGAALHPLASIKQNTLWAEAWLPFFIASGELDRFLNGSVYSGSVRSSRANGVSLLGVVKEYTENANKDDNAQKPLGDWPAYRLSKALTDFETVLTAEFGLMPMLLVTPKRGYDLNTLAFNGVMLFPDSIPRRVPEAVDDLNAGCRCLAFESFTAAAFHFHRANEAVLRRYWEAVLPGRAHPGHKTIGDYLRALGKSRKGSPKVKAALRDIKDLYRNPVLHPDYQLKTADEAIALMNSIHTAIVQMLESIPDPPQPAA